MPESFDVKDFSQGWCPSDDPVNGRINGFQKMENLSLTKNGAIYNVGAKTSRRTYTNPLHSLYNANVAGTDTIYAIDTSGNILRNGTNIGTGASHTVGTFSPAFDYTLICSGVKRIKDNGTTVTNLGITAETNPVTLTKVYYITASLDNATLGAGAVGGATLSQSAGVITFTGAHSFNGSDTFGTVSPSAFDNAGNTDESILTVPTTSLSAAINLDDTIGLTLSKNVGDAFSFLDNVRAVILVITDGSGNAIQFTWQSTFGGFVGSAPIINFVSQTSVRLSVDRNNLQSGGVFDWSAVQLMGVTVITDNSADYIFDIAMDDHFTGGPWENANLVANNIEYMQVNVANNGSYQGRSEAGPSTGFLYSNGFVFEITPQVPADAQVTEVQIYRRGNTVADWRLVLTFPIADIATPQIDGMTDAVALLQSGFDLSLISTASIEDILDIVGPFEGRWFFFTKHFCYPSDIIDPDLVNGSSLVIKLTAGDTEGFLWARAVNPNTILVGTTANIYVLQGTFITQGDGSIDAFYAPLNVQHKPINKFAQYDGGQVYYASADGWRSVSYNGAGSIYTVPSLERLYQGEVCAGYAAVTYTTTPLVISNNKLWGFTNSGIHVYDFTRQYWHLEYPSTTLTAACSSIAGNPLVCDNLTVYELNRRDSTPSISVNLVSVQFDFNKPKQRKDLYTIRVRCLGTGTISVKVGIDQVGLVEVGAIALTASSAEYFFDLADPLISGTPSKLVQVSLSGSITAFTLEYFAIDYDARPIPITYLRIPATNYGSYAYKRVFDQPFEVDTLNTGLNITPVVDGNILTTQTVTVNRKSTISYQFKLIGSTGDILQGIDYEYLLESAAAGQFEFLGILPPKNMEVFPELRIAHVIPTFNGGNALKKRLRVWPIEINTRSADVRWTPIVDGAALTELTTSITGSNRRRTVLLHFPEDVIGIDFSAYLQDFSGTALWEMWNVLTPEVVQILPIAKRFDQLGPIDFSTYGKITKFELRMLAFGTLVPWQIYTQDDGIFNGSITTLNGKESTYEINIPKGCNGRIMRIEFGPVEFDMHRYYARFLVARSGVTTDNQWVTIPQESNA